MKSNCLVALLIAALPVSSLMAQSSNSRKPSKPISAPDLPVKGAVTSNSCAAYGPGFVKLEGSDTCVQLGGSIGIGVGGSTGGRR